MRSRAGREPLAVLLPLLALLPPAFVFVGIIWRDVLFARDLAARRARSPIVAAERAPRLRVSLQALALALCAFGVLLRPNALIAAPLLAAYIVWPARFSWKRTAILSVPAMAAFFALVQVVYYGALGATRQHPLQSIMVFDLGGISHFAKQNQFPVTWNAPETAMLLNTCYQPTEWDIYWRLEPCHFVMRQTRKRTKAVRHAGHDRRLAARYRAPSAGLSRAPRGLHVEFSRRRQPDDVDRRYREAGRDRVSRIARPSAR